MGWAARISLWIRIALFFLRDFNRHRPDGESKIHPLAVCARAGSEGAIAALQHLLGLRLVLSLSLSLSLCLALCCVRGQQGGETFEVTATLLLFATLLIRDWSCGCSRLSAMPADHTMCVCVARWCFAPAASWLWTGPQSSQKYFHCGLSFLQNTADCAAPCPARPC